ncbi:IMPACT family protein [Maribacter thermophilus]|uniref:IMPACT family protein n=1 Tax=Maribacter thermophilus TaxID=1197874 RepID=UPI0006415532|nr:YigZ family protein [Maribacter thermophilus]
MKKASDIYKTIAKPSEEILFKEKKSKFYGYAFPIKQEEEVKDIIENLKAKHPSANHVCYAWQIGVESPTYRANDDGEPNNTAGMPIYGQIQSYNLTNILVAVARIFGGTKLGVGGLISAYRETAKLTLENSTIKEEILQKQITLRFSYEEMDIVMRFIKKHQLEIISQEMHLKCELVISVRQTAFEKIKKLLKAYHKIEIST